MYPFLVEHLGLDPTGIMDSDTGVFDESGTVVETPQQMRVFRTLAEMPAHRLAPGSPVPLH